MSIFATPIEIWNAALLRCGESPTSEQEDSPEAMLYRGSYEIAVRAALCKHKWSFAQKTALLRKQGPSGDWPAVVYTAPEDLVLLHKVTRAGVMVNDIETRGGKILSNCDAADLVAHYTHRAPESLWPDDFADALVTNLEAHIRRFHEDYDTAEKSQRRADGLMIDALTRDRQSQAGTPVSPHAPLVDAWRGARRA